MLLMTLLRFQIQHTGIQALVTGLLSAHQTCIWDEQ